MRVKLDYKKRRHTEKVEEDIYDFTIINHCWNNLSVVKWLVRWGRLLSSSLLYTPLDIKEENFMPKQPKHQSCLTWLAVDSQINSSKLFFGTIMAHHFHESWNGGIEKSKTKGRIILDLYFSIYRRWCRMFPSLESGVRRMNMFTTTNSKKGSEKREKKSGIKNSH